jgi:hypothetical protein
MNALACVVHDLVTGEDVAGLHGLSPLEQETLADLQSLLRRPPRELAALLARTETPEPWWTPLSVACDRSQS